MDPSPQGSFSVGTSFGPYQVLGEIARGGQGLVLKARHQEGTLVALKILLRAEGSALKRFNLETGVLARLFHPSLPRILDTGQVEGRPYLAMQLVEGKNLEQRLKHGGPLPAPEAIKVLGPIAQALEYCHSFSVFHRDLKPANIMVEESTQRPFLVDFGVLKRDASDGALSLDDVTQLSLSGELIGTMSYMAPEQTGATKFSVDARTDVYGLSATLYHLLTGVPPIQGPSAYNTLLLIVNEPPQDPRELRPEIPAAVARVCLWGLAKAPDDRPSSPVELLAALRAALLEPEARARRGLGGLTWGGAAVALICAAVLLGAGWWVGQPPPPAPSPTASPTASPASPARSPARTPAEPPPTPKPTPRPTRPPPPSLELGEPGALHAKLSRPGDLSPLRRVGPWLLTHSGPQALAYREGALAEGAVFLPKGAKALSWDPRAKALFYAQQGKTYRITETGSVETKRPFGFTYIPLGGLTVAVTRKGQLRAFLPSAPSPAAWTLKLPHVPASPLALDLDRDGVPDHLLVCLLEPRALLIDAKGAIRAEIQLPGGVAHSPLLLEAPNGVQQVVVPCAQGVLVRLGVEPYRLSELARLDLLEPLSGPPALVRVRGRPRLIAAVVAGAGLIATSTDLRAVEWVGRRARPGVLSLSGPGVVDLDRDGEPELAIARLQMGGGSRAWLEVHRLDGSWVADLEAGAGDVRVAVGTGPQLVASGPGGLFAWGPWQSLPLPEQDVSLEERVWASLLGGAWERAREGAAELGGARGATYAAFISRHLGEGDRRAEVSRADFEQAFGAMRQAVPNASPWVLDRLFGQQASPRPPLDDLQPLAAVMAPPKGRRRGVVFRGGKTKLHGADALEVARFETQRALFSAGGRLAFRVSLESEQICRIVVKSEVYNVKRTGFAQLELSLDGRHFGGISCMYSIGGEQHVSLGRLAAGTHRIELEVTRSTAVVRLKQVWLETEK